MNRRFPTVCRRKRRRHSNAKFVREFGNPKRMPAESWAKFSKAEQARMVANGAFCLVRPDEWLAYDAMVQTWLEKRRERYGKRR
jgi:hypothetical protein